MTINEYNNLFKNPATKHMTLVFSEDGESDITLNNTQICSEEMDLEQSLCEETGLQFGACNASCFKIKIVNNGDFKGKIVNVTMNVDNAQDSQNPIVVKYGQFKVISDELSNDRMWRTLTCYDSMYDIINADVATWFEGLTFPMTIKSLRDSFFNYLGIQQVSVTLINDNFVTEGGFVSEGKLSGKTVIEAICQINGVFGHINANGLFDYVSIPSQTTVTYDWYIDGTGKYEDYVTDKITGIIARDNDDDVGTSVGTDTNRWVITRNPLIFGTEGSQELIAALTNLFNKVKDISFRPFEVDTYGNPGLPIGTSIKLNVKRYDPEQGYSTFELNSLVIKRELSGLQGLVDHISATGDKTLSDNVNSYQSEILRTKGKVHDLKITVDELYSDIYDADTGLKSTIQQLANEEVLKVESETGTMVLVRLSIDPDDPSASEFQVSADNISFFANNVMQLTANHLGISSTYFSVDEYGNVEATSLTARNTGSVFSTIIDADEMKVVNNLDDDVYVSILAQAWTPPFRTESYTSGRISISDGDYESNLTSRDLYINRVNSNHMYLMGPYHRVIEELTNCGLFISKYNEDTELYSGFVHLLGEEADIAINQMSIINFNDGEPFICDYRGAGFITTSASKVWFTFPLPKSAYGMNVTCVDFIGRIRLDGKYIHGVYNGMNPINAVAHVTADGYNLQVELTKGVDSQQQLIPYGNKKKLNNRVVGIDLDGTFIFTKPIPVSVEEEEEE